MNETDSPLSDTELPDGHGRAVPQEGRAVAVELELPNQGGMVSSKRRGGTFGRAVVTGKGAKLPAHCCANAIIAGKQADWPEKSKKRMFLGPTGR